MHSETSSHQEEWWELCWTEQQWRSVKIVKEQGADWSLTALRNDGNGVGWSHELHNGRFQRGEGDNYSMWQGEARRALILLPGLYRRENWTHVLIIYSYSEQPPHEAGKEVNWGETRDPSLGSSKVWQWPQARDLPSWTLNCQMRIIPSTLSTREHREILGAKLEQVHTNPSHISPFQKLLASATPEFCWWEVWTS